MIARRCAAGVLLGVTFAADGAQPHDLSPGLAKAVEHFEVPALAAAVIDSQGVIRRGVAGVSIADTDTPLDVDDAFHIGSCTKAMTATLVGVLVDEGVLELDDTLPELLPDLGSDMHEAFRAVTLRDLLRHRGGVAAFTSGASPEGRHVRNLPDDPKAARAEFARRVLTEEPAHERGTFAYSNGGYGIAAAAIEAATDTAWEALMQEKIFEPLGMTTAGFGWPADADPTAPRGHFEASGDHRPHTKQRPYHLQSPIDPAGDVFCSIGDWATFAIDQLTSLRGEPGGLVSPETMHELHTSPEGGDYACGWIIARVDDRVIHAHDGSAGTFYASVWLAPEGDRGVLVVTNTGGGEPAVEAVRNRLLKQSLAPEADNSNER